MTVSVYIKGFSQVLYLQVFNQAKGSLNVIE